MGSRSVFSVIIVFFLCTCIDPYSPKLKGYESLLVVDGLITDEAASYTVRLSRTTREQDAVPVQVPDASVYISDDNGNTAGLISAGDGTYRTDSNSFRGETGRNYTLHIITSDGNEYKSDPATMQPVSDIDSIYFGREQELVNNGSETQDGIMIYLDSKNNLNNSYLRWDFEEIWKFRVPTPKKFDYINDTTILPVKNVNAVGWKENRSSNVLIRSLFPEGGAGIVKEPLNFVAPEMSDRLSVQYSIMVRQYSVSMEEYEFWNSMIKVNNSGADIFASQPFPVLSNIHNIDNPGELVLGYFQVSAVKQRRKYITFNEIKSLELPLYHYQCQRIEKEPKDYKMPWGVPPTWDDVYRMFCINTGFDFVEPLYIPGTIVLSKLVFASPECADSEVTGTLIKPDFWIDLN